MSCPISASSAMTPAPAPSTRFGCKSARLEQTWLSIAARLRSDWVSAESRPTGARISTRERGSVLPARGISGRVDHGLRPDIGGDTGHYALEVGQRLAYLPAAPCALNRNSRIV